MVPVILLLLLGLAFGIFVMLGAKRITKDPGLLGILIAVVCFLGLCIIVSMCVGKYFL